MSALSSYISSLTTAVVAGLVALVGLIAAFVWSRHRMRWIVGILIVLWGVILFIWWNAGRPDIDPRLPSLYLKALPIWLFVLGAATVLGVARLVATRGRGEAASTDIDTAFPDLEASWAEILSTFAAARIDPSRMHWHLLLGPESSEVDALVEAASLRPLATAPSSVEAPLRAVATAEGVLLNATGCTALGARAAGGDARLARLCEMIVQLRPELPPVRSVTLVLPIAWAAQPESSARAAVARDDLRRIADSTGLQVPTYVVFGRLQTLQGTTEFLRRLPPEMLSSRCGFSLPDTASQPLQANLTHGFAWIVQWFSVWTLNLMVQDYTQHAGNAALLSLTETLRDMRPNLEGLLSGLFAAADPSQPSVLRGIYFAATGETADQRGFAPGLLRGARARLLADHAWTSWNSTAMAEDARDRKLAAGLLVATAVVAAVVWGYAIALNLHAARKDWLTAVCGVATAAMIAGVVLWRRRGQASSTRTETKK